MSGRPMNNDAWPSSAILTNAADVSCLNRPLAPDAIAPMPMPMPWYFGSLPNLSFQPDFAAVFSMHSFRPQLA